MDPDPPEGPDQISALSPIGGVWLFRPGKMADLTGLGRSGVAGTGTVTMVQLCYDLE